MAPALQGINGFDDLTCRVLPVTTSRGPRCRSAPEIALGRRTRPDDPFHRQRFGELQPTEPLVLPDDPPAHLIIEPLEPRLRHVVRCRQDQLGARLGQIGELDDLSAAFAAQPPAHLQGETGGAALADSDRRSTGMMHATARKPQQLNDVLGPCPSERVGRPFPRLRSCSAVAGRRASCSSSMSSLKAPSRVGAPPEPISRNTRCKPPRTVVPETGRIGCREQAVAVFIDVSYRPEVGPRAVARLSKMTSSSKRCPAPAPGQAGACLSAAGHGRSIDTWTLQARSAESPL